MNEQTTPQAVESTTASDWKHHFTKVTPLSKFLAMILFIALPFAGFGLGLRYGKDLEKYAISDREHNTQFTEKDTSPGGDPYALPNTPEQIPESVTIYEIQGAQPPVSQYPSIEQLNAEREHPYVAATSTSSWQAVQDEQLKISILLPDTFGVERWEIPGKYEEGDNGGSTFDTVAYKICDLERQIQIKEESLRLDELQKECVRHQEIINIGRYGRVMTDTDIPFLSTNKVVAQEKVKINGVDGWRIWTIEDYPRNDQILTLIFNDEHARAGTAGSVYIQFRAGLTNPDDGAENNVNILNPLAEQILNTLEISG